MGGHNNKYTQLTPAPLSARWCEQQTLHKMGPLAGLRPRGNLTVFYLQLGG